MPVYTYRREDGTEFEIRQKFSDDPLTVDPETGQKVHRVIHAAGIVFKGSGFYVNDSKGSKSNLSTPTNTNGNGNGSTNESDSKSENSNSNGSGETSVKKDDTKSVEKTGES